MDTFHIWTQAVSDGALCLSATLISLPSPTAAPSNILYHPPCCDRESLCKGLGCSGNKFLPDYFFFHNTVSYCIWGANWINLSLSDAASTDIHQSVCMERITFQPSFRERQGYTLLPVKGTVPFLTAHPPIALAASYVNCAERQRKIAKWSVGEMQDIWLTSAGGEIADGDDILYGWCWVSPYDNNCVERKDRLLQWFKRITALVLLFEV